VFTPWDGRDAVTRPRRSGGGLDPRYLPEHPRYARVQTVLEDRGLSWGGGVRPSAVTICLLRCTELVGYVHPRSSYDALSVTNFKYFWQIVHVGELRLLMFE
jgi:hypothetical protein